MAQGWRAPYTRYREFYLNVAALYKQRADLRAFLEIILSISTIIIFSLFALKPTALTIISLLQQIKEKESTLSALTQKVKNLQTASDVRQQNQNYIPDIDTAVPEVPEPDILSEQMQGIAAKNSVQLLGVSIEQIPLVGNSISGNRSEFEPLPGGAEEMPFSVIVKGGFPNLLLFIKDFENMRIAAKVDVLGVNSAVSDKGLTITAVVSGRAPYLGK